MPSCYNSFVLKDTGQKTACGKCVLCLKRRVSGWSKRLLEHDKLQSVPSHFITLTYDSIHVPITENGLLTLSAPAEGVASHLQAFFKRLRKAHPPGTEIKYFAVGEYGDRTDRPHYHVILFGSQLSKIQPAWWYGKVHYGQVQPASVAYSLTYIFKRGHVPAFEGDDRSKERAYISKGLGLGYLTDEMRLWHKADLKERMYLNIEGGKKIAMPRYYKLKLYSDEERKIIADTIQEKLVKEEMDTIQSMGFASYKRQLNEVAKATTLHRNAAKLNNSIKSKI